MVGVGVRFVLEVGVVNLEGFWFFFGYGVDRKVGEDNFGFGNFDGSSL